MLLAINIGNTNITAGIFEDEKIVGSWKTDKEKGEDFEDKLSNLKNIDGVIIASVVPQLTPGVIEVLKKLKLPDPMIVGSSMRLPIKLDVDHPEKVGMDLIANMAAAHELYPKPAIVLDCGTATTFCVISANSEFKGAVIAPGLQSLARSLSENAALLPDVEITKPENIVGRNTIESMQTGTYYGYLGLVKELLKKVKEENLDAKVIATGGNIKSISNDLDGIDSIDEDLVVKGLQVIYELNV